MDALASVFPSPIAFPKAKFPALAIFSACVCNSACVGPVQKPLCWFSHDAAQMSLVLQMQDFA